MSTFETHRTLLKARRLFRRVALFARALEYYFPSISIGPKTDGNFTIHGFRKAIFALYATVGAIFTGHNLLHGYQLFNADEEVRETVLQTLTWLACYTGTGKELGVFGDVINLAIIAELDLAKDDYYKESE